jgi:dipeptidyl aminopeptidase/acylaminoacyl peptidase
LAAAALAFSPRIVSVSPAGTADSAREPIVVQFSRPIAAGQAETRFSIYPPAEGRLHLDGNRLIFNPTEPLSYGRRYQIRLRGGLRPATGYLPVWLGKRWTFTVGPPRLVYLRPDGEAANVWLREPSGASRPLTAEVGGVWDYQVLPNGQGVLVAAQDGSGRDLVRYDREGGRQLVLDCGPDACLGGQWQPGGVLVAFERAAPGDEGEVWLIDTETGRQWPAHDRDLLQAAGFATLTSSAPRWSADGRYLAYFKPDARLIIVLDMDGREEPHLVPANLELMGEWSPTGLQLAYTELAFGEGDPQRREAETGTETGHTEGGLFSHLVVTDLRTGVSRDLSAGLAVSDGRPSWSPDGRQLTLSRTETGSGRQIWILALDGSAPRPLTKAPLMNYSALAWAPDGRTLAYMRSDFGRPDSRPTIWLRDLDTGREEMAAEGAHSPAWLP